MISNNIKTGIVPETINLIRRFQLISFIICIFLRYYNK